MEKKTVESLRAMLCKEIEDIAKKGNLTRESLDILKDLIETEKNIGKIEHYDSEKEMKEGLIPYDMGYSQRKYFIDADYQPGMNSYARGMGRNSYGMDGRVVYDVDSGNSYAYYDPMRMPMYTMRGEMGNSNARGYSRHSDPQEMKKELNEMMNETQDVKVKDAIQKLLNEMNK